MILLDTAAHLSRAVLQAASHLEFSSDTCAFAGRVVRAKAKTRIQRIVLFSRAQNGPKSLCQIDDREQRSSLKRYWISLPNTVGVAQAFGETRLCVVPNLFIGIELRGIARQRLDNDVAFTFFNEPLQCFAAMVAGIVRVHNDRLAGIRSEIARTGHHSFVPGRWQISYLRCGLTALIRCGLRPEG